ncbi:rhomboid family intramembrane serine protease [Alteromonas sp. 14N.309.X.WAT.G.H12]|uniref:rhomboid family intramembrane serine protease n=1 Tax=Alteromonas sp. 14N.309.X.WAT.G.H12 TaxID=3120824 RepID=UPI002FCF4D13
MRQKKPHHPAVEITDLTTFIKKWRPIDAWLVEDSDGQFVLPPYHSTIGGDIFAAYRQTTIKNYGLFLLALMVICGYFFLIEPKANINQLLVYISLFFIVSIDALLNILTLKHCQHRAEFCFNLHQSFRKNLLIYLPLFFIIGALQYLGCQLLGSTENVIITLGNYYPAIEVSSIWRFIIGPFIHLDIKHWLLNLTATLLFVSSIPSLASSPSTARNITTPKQLFGIFILGAIFSHIVTYAVNTSIYLGIATKNDALVGVSGGSYGILAYAICYYSFAKKQFNIVFSLLGLAVFTLISPYLLQHSITSHTAHISGFIFGLLSYGLVYQSTASPADQPVPL